MKQRNMRRKFALLLLAAGIVAVLTACSESETTTTPQTTTPAITATPATTPSGTVAFIEHVQFTGTIESISNGTYVIGGQTFVTNATTQIDVGLATGVTARAEFIVQADGTKLATRIRDRDEAGEPIKIEGLLASISNGTYVIGGQTFVTNAATIIQDGLMTGDPARAQFSLQADGTKLASRIEARFGEDFKITGTIESIGNGAYVIGGQTFATDAATRIDTGLAVGITATVQYIFQADRTRVATEIQTDAEGIGREDLKFTGVIESISTDTWVIGGQTFKVDQNTMLDSGLMVGVTARVEYFILADSTKLAKQIETP